VVLAGEEEDGIDDVAGEYEVAEEDEDGCEEDEEDVGCLNNS